MKKEQKITRKVFQSNSLINYFFCAEFLCFTDSHKNKEKTKILPETFLRKKKHLIKKCPILTSLENTMNAMNELKKLFFIEIYFKSLEI